jgi:hypothetical protein
MVHEDVPHRARRDTEEVSPTLPADPVLIDESNECLVDQVGGLQ